MRGSISIENISFSINCDIKITNAESVTDASIWVMFISKSNDTLELREHIVCLTLPLSFAAVDFISGQLISLTNPIHRIHGQFVKKTVFIIIRLFCDRALYHSKNEGLNNIHTHW